MRRGSFLIAGILIWLLAGLTAGAATAYTVTPGPLRPVARFKVTYSGSGTWATTYHSEPSDGGGKHDTNDAHDSSTQAWSISYPDLVVPTCGKSRRNSRDPCRRLTSLQGAHGTTTATGTIDHRHVDGLYSFDDVTLRCTVSAATPRGQRLADRILLGYDPRTRALSLMALDPVVDVLTVMPGECPGQGDPIDGLANNYFTPGFSFAAGWGPGPWFRSALVRIPVATLHRARAVRIPLGDTRAGTPPPGCRVQNPTWERCSTGGSWTGVLTLTATG